MFAKHEKPKPCKSLYVSLCVECRRGYCMTWLYIYLYTAIQTEMCGKFCWLQGCDKSWKESSVTGIWTGSIHTRKRARIKSYVFGLYKAWRCSWVYPGSSAFKWHQHWLLCNFDLELVTQSLHDTTQIISCILINKWSSESFKLFQKLVFDLLVTYFVTKEQPCQHWFIPTRVQQDQISWGPRQKMITQCETRHIYLITGHHQLQEPLIFWPNMTVIPNLY